MRKAQPQIDRRRFLQPPRRPARRCVAFARAGDAPMPRIKIGYVTPQTGPLAAFAASDDFNIKGFMEATKGVVESAGSIFDVEVVVRDSQSNPNRAAEVAKELIVDDEVDLMLVASTPGDREPCLDPMRDRAVPCISNNAPWQPWFIGRQADPAGGRRHGSRSTTPTTTSGASRHRRGVLDMWNQLDTNKIVGGLFPTTATAMLGRHVVGVRLCSKGALQDHRSGRYQNLTDDFSAQIRRPSSKSPSIVTGVVLPPDFDARLRDQATSRGLAKAVEWVRRSSSGSRWRRWEGTATT